jgi:hypothetical protein
LRLLVSPLVNIFPTFRREGVALLFPNARHGSLNRRASGIGRKASGESRAETDSRTRITTLIIQIQRAEAATRIIVPISTTKRQP